MVLPGFAHEWARLSPWVRREELGVLKAHLKGNPADETTRRELVQAYRDLGHRDQAGRFAIGLPEGAMPDEIKSYANLVRGLKADLPKVRTLSVLAPDVPLPDELMSAMEDSPLAPSAFSRLLATCVAAWMLSGTLFVVTLGSTYVAGLRAARDVAMLARMGTAITGWTLVGTFALTAACCARYSTWRVAVGWACATAVALACGVLSSLGA